MSSLDFLQNAKRNQTLIVVEGDHEKTILLSIVLSAFPEIPVLNENIHVYGADIYDLYHDIEKEYEKDWYEDNELEIDIPMLISRRNNIEPQLNRKNFTNIILVFDYEHHDIWYSDEKIQRMQNHFNSVTLSFGVDFIHSVSALWGLTLLLFLYSIESMVPLL